MLDIAVKSLDGKNVNFTVPDNITVKEFKERIAGSVGITAESQRLIFLGRVLQDEHKLSHYDIHGKVLHVVERAPPSARRPPSDANTTPRNSSSTRTPPGGMGGQRPPSAVHVMSMPNVMTQQPSGAAMEFHVSVRDLRREATVSEAHKRLTGAQRMISRACRVLDSIENVNQTEDTPSPSSQTSSLVPDLTSTAADTTQEPVTSATTTAVVNGEVTPSVTDATPVSMETENDETTTASLCGGAGAIGGTTVADSSGVEGQQNGEIGGPGESSEIEVNGEASAMMGQAEAVIIETVEAEMEIEVDEENGTVHVNRVSQTNSPHISHSIAVGSDDAGSQTSSQSAEAGSQTAQSTSTGTQTDNQADNAECPPSSLAEVLESVFQLNQRLQPHLERYHGIMREEEPTFDGQEQSAQDVQTFTDRVAEVLHFISHAYHNISDLMIDTSRAPPRQLRAHPTVLQQRVNSETHQTIAATPVVSMETGPAGAAATTHSGTPQGAGALPPMSIPAGAPLTFMQPHSEGFAIGNISAHIVPASAAAALAAQTTPTIPTTATGMSFSPGVSQATPPTTVPSSQASRMPTATTTATNPPPISLSGNGNMRINLMGGPQGMVRTGGGGIQYAAGGPHPTSINIHIGRGGPGGMTGGMRPGMLPMFPGAMSMRGARHPLGRRGGNNRGRASRGGRGGVRQSSASGSSPQSEGVTNMETSLPCYSRHFLRQPPTAAATNSHDIDVIPAVLPTVISTVIGGIVQNINAQAATSSASQTSATGQAATSNTSTSTTGSQGPVPNPFAALFGGDVNAPVMAQAGLQLAGNFMDQLRNVLQTGQQPGQGPAAAATGQTTGTAPPVPTTGTNSTPSTSSGSAQTRPTAAPTATTGGQPASTGGGAGGSRPMTDDMFAQLVHGIGQLIGQASVGQTPQGTITEFLSNMGEDFNTPPGESVLSDVFNVLANCLSFMDLMQVFSGVSNSLQNARVPLQRYIREQLMQGAEVTPQSIEQCVDRQMEIAAPVIEAACVNLRTREDIDFEASMNTFLEYQTGQIITFIMNAREDDADFHINLYTRMRRMLHELVILGENSLEGGFQALVTLVQSRIGDMVSEVNPMIRQWMASMTASQLQNMRPGITLVTDDIHHYIIRRSPTRMDTGSMRSSDDNEDFLSADEDITDGSASSESKKAKYDTSAANTSKKTHHAGTPTSSTPPTLPPPQPSTSTASSQASSGGVRPKYKAFTAHGNIQPRDAPEGGELPLKLTEGAPLRNENGELQDVDYNRSTARLRPQMTPMAYHTVRCATRPSHDTVDKPSSGSLGSEDWHGVVPQDWVEVIATDVERQKTLERQRPLSDAYIGGNPAKKRKVAMNRSDTEELALPQDSLPEAILAAASAVGAEPITSLDTLPQEVQSNPSLQQAFHSEVRGEVRRQLRDNKDLVPRKYASTEKYFGNKK